MFDEAVFDSAFYDTGALTIEPPPTGRIVFARFNRMKKRNIGRDGKIAWDAYKIRSR